MPAELLGWLRQEALTLVEHELPSEEELRGVVGSLVKALERVAGDEVAKFRAPSAPESPVTQAVPVTDRPPVPQTAPAAAAVPAEGPLSPAEQATLDALVRRAEASADPAPTDPDLEPVTPPTEQGEEG